MKNSSISLAIACIVITALHAKTTVEVAEQLGVPKVLYNLRAKAQRALTRIGVDMALDVQELRSKDLTYRAEGLQNADHGTILDIEERFDREFERIDRELLQGANRLDDEDAPYSKKAAFVTDVQTDAEVSINELLQSYQKVT